VISSDPSGNFDYNDPEEDNGAVGTARFAGCAADVLR
jgi:hypothetical protein